MSTFATLIREHSAYRQSAREQNEALRRQVAESMTRVSQELMDAVNKEVALAFARQRAVEQEIKALQTQTAEFVKRSAQWVALVSSFSTALKEMGDVENWSRVIETDMDEICQRLEAVHRKTQPNI